MKTTVCLLLLSIAAACAGEMPRINSVDAQPLLAQARRVLEALDYLGAPLPPDARKKIEDAAATGDGPSIIKTVQDVLDPFCLYAVHINPESRVKVAAGPAKPELQEQGWRVFLLKVHNEAGVTTALKTSSPHALPLHGAPKAEVLDRWLDLQHLNAQPMTPTLSGLVCEYRVIQLYSRDAGKREAKVSFNVGQGTQDLGFRDAADILFDARPSNTITFRVRDEKDQPTTACFEIRDKAKRVYPSQTKRLAPDFSFHPQIYRGDGETVRLPDGEYSVEITRGPEYRKQMRTLTVKGATEFAVKLERWVDPAAKGWWSGDHHIHAAGCAHYEKPSEGVHAPDVGPLFRLPEKILHRQRRSGLKDAVHSSLRHRSVRLRLAPVRASLPVALERPDVSRRRFQSALADTVFEHAALGEETRRDLRPCSFRMGA
jgi:hypothetical protein